MIGRFLHKQDSATSEAMRKFDAINKGMRVLFTPDSDVIDVASFTPTYDKYVSFGGNVFARFIRNTTDMIGREELAASEILSGLTDADLGVAMFCEFGERGVMLKQRHPQFERGWVIDGTLTDRVTGITYPAGSVFEFDRMTAHEPYSLAGCFLFLNFIH